MAGLNCGTPSLVAWPLLRSGLDAVVAVADERARQAMRDLAAAGIVAGETGAASLAGLEATGAGRPAGCEVPSASGQGPASCWCAPRAPPTRRPTIGSWRYLT